MNKSNRLILWIWVGMSLVLASLIIAGCNRTDGSAAPADAAMAPPPTETPAGSTQTTQMAATSTPSAAVLDTPEVSIPTTGLLPTPQAPAETTNGSGGGGESIYVTTSRAFADQFGDWRIVGEIYNGSDQTVTNVELTIEIVDAVGNLLLRDIGGILVSNLAPGETTPFSYYIGDPSVVPEQFKVSVSNTRTATIKRVALDIVNIRLVQDDFGDFHCTGEVVNNSDVPVEIDGLAAAVIAANGELLTAEWYWAVARHLEPGEHSPFRISPYGPAEAAERCKFFVDSRQADSMTPFAVEVVSTSHYTDRDGGVHLVGEVVNLGAEAIRLQLIGGLYAADGTVLDADLTTIPVAIAPGERGTFDFNTLSAATYSPGIRSLIDHASVTVDVYWSYPAPTRQIALPITDQFAQLQDEAILLTGMIHNDQDFTAIAVDIVANIRRQDDNSLVALGHGNIFESIPAGASAPFSMTVLIPTEVDVATLAFELIAKTDLPE